MKPISDEIANANPESHDLFEDWIQSCNDVKTALLQNSPNLAGVVRRSHAKLDAYLLTVRAREHADSERVGKAAWALASARRT